MSVEFLTGQVQPIDYHKKNILQVCGQILVFTFLFKMLLFCYISLVEEKSRGWCFNCLNKFSPPWRDKKKNETRRKLYN